MKDDLLIIHGDPRFRIGVRELAEDLGYRFCESDRAVEGVLLAREAQPTAVLLDMEPRDMEGFTALALIRAQVRSQARVLALGLEEESLQGLALETGADATLPDTEDLQAIERFLRDAKRRPGKALSAAIASLP